MCIRDSDNADAAGHRLLHHLYFHLRRSRSQESTRRDGADSTARHSPIGADPRLSHLHRRLLHELVSRPRVRRRARLCVRDLHQPGLEHDVQHVPVDAQRPEGFGRASQSFHLSGWQRFWRLDVPFAMPGLIWNTMMSMSGGWFFVVASEAITVGNTTVTLPGIGSYVALGIQKQNLPAIGYAILTMLLVIIAYDQLLFRPVVAWADKFRFEQTASARTGICRPRPRPAGTAVDHRR